MQGIPGATSSGVTTTGPLSGNNLGLGFTIDGRPSDPNAKPSASSFAISPNYFDAMKIRLVRGRAFTERDTETSQGVVIINEMLARKHLPCQDPNGRHLSIVHNILQ